MLNVKHVYNPQAASTALLHAGEPQSTHEDTVIKLVIPKRSPPLSYTFIIISVSILRRFEMIKSLFFSQIHCVFVLVFN